MPFNCTSHNNPVQTERSRARTRGRPEFPTAPCGSPAPVVDGRVKFSPAELCLVNNSGHSDGAALTCFFLGGNVKLEATGLFYARSNQQEAN